MNSSLSRTLVSVIFTMTLAGCGGGSSDSAQNSNNPVIPPENGSSIAKSDLTKQEALSALNTPAVNKVDPVFLNRVLEQTSSEVIAEFVNESSLTDSFEQKKATYAKTKSRLAALLPSSEYEVIIEYDALPMDFVRLKSRRALVNFLNNVDVKAIYENQQHAVTVLNKQEALSALNPVAISKVNPDFLGRVLDQTSSEVLVEFVNQSLSTDSFEQKMVTYANTRSRAATALASSDYEIIIEYKAFPVSFIRLKSRNALVNFLNNPYVIAIYENKQYTLPILLPAEPVR